MRVRVSAARRSQARSMVCSSDDIAALGRCVGDLVDAPRERIAERGLCGGTQWPVGLVGNEEKILDAFAERGDTRIVDADAAVAEDLGNAGQQTGPVGADQ